MAASQGMAAARAAEEAVRPPAQRFRVNVPAADEAVLAWMAMQDNHSLSVRLLIRENIERNGYIDVMNRPVEQLPKRGRPAAADDAVQRDAAQGSPSPQPVRQLLPTAPAPAAPDAPAAAEESAVPEAPTGQDDPQQPQAVAVVAPEPVPAPQSVATPPMPLPVPSDPEPPASGQLDVNDIFASMR